MHLYLINDGSPAVTAADVQFLQERRPHFTSRPYPINRGKGYALRTGLEQVKERIGLFTDSDFSL
ncbi:glycosyltransferase [Hymenobacter taeanensis]|uniref:Glycosyltransferase n=1 Tax=Hymenobacter taeanensis TaxID=2735321 RepID=A0A6M6BMR7_9BACT|nr:MULTISPECIES: glycosyltransferase [Hymenobacter]QJX48753.1 glycosyltransferase [Hymenobacter taeanensis]UOQ81741.1 glycosyltransferase [Hymenobacter sp. 5414T-23]